MNLLHKQIIHKTFGCGVIVEMIHDTITVLFADEIGKKRFLYPEAFEQFLVMEDPDMKEIVNRDLFIKLKRNEEARLVEVTLMREAALIRAKETTEEKAASKKKPAAKKASSMRKTVKKAVQATSTNG